MTPEQIQRLVREEVNGTFAPLVDAVNRNTLEIRRALAAVHELDGDDLKRRRVFMDTIDDIHRRLRDIESAATKRKITAVKAANRRKIK